MLFIYRQVVGSWSVSLETALLLRQVVSVARWNQVNVLINLVKDVGGKLVMAQPRGIQNCDILSTMKN